MKIVLKSDQELALDGITVKRYKAGDVCEASRPQEFIVLRSLVERGFAEPYNPAEPKQTKVTTPKQTKAKK